MTTNTISVGTLRLAKEQMRILLLKYDPSYRGLARFERGALITCLALGIMGCFYLGYDIGKRTRPICATPSPNPSPRIEEPSLWSGLRQKAQQAATSIGLIQETPAIRVPPQPPETFLVTARKRTRQAALYVGSPLLLYFILKMGCRAYQRFGLDGPLSAAANEIVKKHPGVESLFKDISKNPGIFGLATQQGRCAKALLLAFEIELRACEIVLRRLGYSHGPAR
jgi:hypothetical protein